MSTPVFVLIPNVAGGDADNLYVNVDYIVAFGADRVTGHTVVDLDNDDIETTLTPEEVEARILAAVAASHADLDEIRDALVNLRRSLP